MPLPAFLRCRLSARAALTVQILVILLLLFPVLLYNMLENWNSVQETAEKQYMTLTRTFVARQLALTDSTHALLRTLSVSVAVRNFLDETGSEENLDLLLQQLSDIQPAYAGFLILTPYGETRASIIDGKPYMLLPQTAQQRRYFIKAMQEKKFSIGDMLYLRNGEKVLPMSRPVLNTADAVQAVLVAPVKVALLERFLEQMLQSAALKPDSMTIFDSEQNLVASWSPHSRDAVELRRILNSALLQDGSAGSIDTSEEYTLQWRSPAGKHTGVVMALRQSPTEVPYMYILTTAHKIPFLSFVLRNYAVQLAGLLGVGVLAFALAHFVGGHFFARGLARMTAIACQGRQGDLHARNGDLPGCREILDLAHAYDNMLEALERSTEHLRQLSYMDPLTKLWNRRRFQEVMHDRLSLLRRKGGMLSVAMLDIDHFKTVNDTWGHAAGDAVLQALAALLRDSVRQSDIVARLGGEEFALVLDGADQDATLAVLEKIRHACAALSVHWEQETIRFTISIGVVLHEELQPGLHLSDPAPETLLASLLEHADTALYASKQQGRNRTTLWSSPPAPASA